MSEVKSLFTVDLNSGLQPTDAIGARVDAVRGDRPALGFSAFGRLLADVAIASGAEDPRATVAGWLGHESIKPPVAGSELSWAFQTFDRLETAYLRGLVNGEVA